MDDCKIIIKSEVLLKEEQSDEGQYEKTWKDITNNEPQEEHSPVEQYGPQHTGEGIENEDVDDSQQASEATHSNKEQFKQREGKMTNIMYVEPTCDDTFLYCEECQQNRKEHCPVHGPLILVQNIKVEANDPDRALHSLPSNLLVKNSSIERAGLGVFTDTEIPPGNTFGPYEGILIRDSELANSSKYCWQIYKDGVVSHYVDAKDTANSNWMRYVNCAPSETDQNLKAFQYKGEIYYRSVQLILPKTELLVWYGDDCARKLGIIKEDNDLMQQDTYEEIPFTRLNTEKRPYKCDFCEKAFPQRPFLIRHVRTHTGEKPYACSFCDKTFTQNSHLNTHLRIHTGEKPYMCKFCDKTFSQKTNLNRHITIHKDDKPYVCKICERTYGHKPYYLQHLKTHNGEKSLICRFCAMSFILEHDFIKHMKTHTGERPYSCNFCDKTFNRKFNLTKHTMIHTGEKPYLCKICGKTFPLKYRVNEHMRTHYGETPYVCKFCEVAFDEKSNLCYHMESHIGLKQHDV